MITDEQPLLPSSQITVYLLVLLIWTKIKHCTEEKKGLLNQQTKSYALTNKMFKSYTIGLLFRCL